MTAGGLVFVGAANDGGFRAFDAKTGKQVWESRTDGQPLTTPENSGSANANPMTYTSKSGKQFVGSSRPATCACSPSRRLVVQSAR